MQIMRPGIQYTLTLPEKYSATCQQKFNIFVSKIIISQQWPFTGNIVQRIILIFEDAGPNVPKTTIQITYIPRRFMFVGVVHHGWLGWQSQGSHTCRTECRIQGHTVGLLTPKFKRSEKFRSRLNYVPFIGMNITSLKLRRLIETKGPGIKVSCSY